MLRALAISGGGQYPIEKAGINWPGFFIGTKMLSKELQKLEINGLIKRTVMDTKPITVKYELTAYGSTLKPIIDEMASWGSQHRVKIIKEISAK